MPVLFIHGVNTRAGEDYDRNLAARNALMQRLVLQPLAEAGLATLHVPVCAPYWGDAGITFRWNMACLPDVQPLHDLGAAGDGPTPRADLVLAQTLDKLNGKPAAGLQALGAEDDPFVVAAHKDLPQVMEAILAPLTLSEKNLVVTDTETPAQIGAQNALLLIAGYEVAADPDVQQEVRQLNTTEEITALLTERVQARFAHLAAEQTNPIAPGLEGQGAGWIQDAQDRLSEFFSRVGSAPARGISLLALDQTRAGANGVIARFTGDVFVYLKERGTAEAPGPIVQIVLDAIAEGEAAAPGEPWFVLTHSMGGNIFYDILTYYRPDLKVAFWASAGGQVGLFEEGKLFVKSDKSIVGPNKTPVPSNVAYWINVYDPADIFSYRVAPIFNGVKEDISYSTGASTLDAHSAYFLRPSFYEALHQHAAKAFAPPPGD